MSAIPPVANKELTELFKTLVNEKTTELYGWDAKRLEDPVPDNDYGKRWPKGMPQYFKEAYGYRQGGIGGISKFDHMVNMIKLDLPNFQFAAKGYINSNALRVIKACCEHQDLGIAGAASTGKTYPVGAWVLQDWKSAPDTTLAFVCTTDLAASEDRIWGAIIKMWQNSVHKVGTYVPHKHVIAWGNFSESASDRDFNSAIKAVAIPKGGEGAKAIATFRGRKQHNVTLVFDELPEMETYVSKGAINLESNTPDENINAFGLRVRGIGNPNDENDAHGQMCRPDHPMGYKSVNPRTAEWKTKTGWCIFLNGEWSPNFEAPPSESIPFPRLTNRKALSAMLVRCHGNKDSLEYWRNAIGFWPNSSVLKTILTEDLIISRECHEGSSVKTLWLPSKRKNVCGLDIGFTAGGDACVANFLEVGKNNKGRTICSWLAMRTYHAEKDGVFEEIIAKQVVDDCIEFNVSPDSLGLDISGDGGKMLAAIIRYWITINTAAVNVFPISSMGKPSERIVSNVDMRKCIDACDRRVTEYWMMAREGVLCEVVRNIPLVNETKDGQHPIVEQLCSRIYSIKGKKFSIETKDDYKLRTAKSSPDHGDSFVYGIEMARRHGLIFNTPFDEKKTKEKKEENWKKSKQTEYTYESDSWGEGEDDGEEVA